MRRRVGALLAVLLLAACGGKSATSTSPTRSPSPTPSASPSATLAEQVCADLAVDGDLLQVVRTAKMGTQTATVLVVELDTQQARIQADADALQAGDPTSGAAVQTVADLVGKIKVTVDQFGDNYALGTPGKAVKTYVEALVVRDLSAQLDLNCP